MTCGECKYFAYRVVGGKLKKWGGQCSNPKRVAYHDASQKACKLYEEYNDGGNKEMGTGRKKKFMVEKRGIDGGWSVGFGLTHDKYSGETYLYLDIFKVHVFIGYMYDWK